MGEGTLRVDLTADCGPMIQALLASRARQTTDEFSAAVDRVRAVLADAAVDVGKLMEQAQRMAVETPLSRMDALYDLACAAKFAAAHEAAQPPHARGGYIKPETIERAARAARR